MNQKQNKVKGFFKTYKKSIFTSVFSLIAMSLIFAVAISSNKPGNIIENNNPNLEINKEEEIPKTIINFNMGGVKVLEKKDYFIIYIVRHMFYIVPKEHFSDEERAMLIKCFKNAQFIPEK